MPAPSADAIALRALCLQAIAVRAQVEQAGAAPSWRGVLDRLTTWVQGEGFAASFSDGERAQWARPAFSWTPGEASDGVWRVEALGTLLFCLGAIAALPPPHAPFDVDAVFDVRPPFSPTLAFVGDARLADAALLDRARRTTGIWAWRVKSELLRRRGAQAPQRADAREQPALRAPAAKGGDALAHVLGGVEKAHTAGVIAALVDGDLPARDGPLHRASSTEVLEIATIVHERALALDWVAGARAWSDEGPAL